MKNETKQSGSKSEYAVNKTRSGAFLWLLLLGWRKPGGLQQIVYINRRSRSKKEIDEKIFEIRMVFDLIDLLLNENL